MSATPTALVTGSTSGIGRVVAEQLGAAGYRVAIVARDPARGALARDEIASATGADVRLLEADLASLKQTRRLAERAADELDRIDVLVNNAAISATRYSTTEDGFESTLAVNHLAPFLLTNLLLPRVRASAPSRVVNVTSTGHARRLDLSVFEGPERWSRFGAYAQSKLAVILFTYELARRVADDGIVVAAVHPGVVGTTLAADVAGPLGVFVPLVRRFMMTPAMAARRIVRAAIAPGVPTGSYYRHRSSPARSKRGTYDAESARGVWDWSAKLTGLAP